MSHFYPTEFLTATLNSFLSKADRIKQFMTVCKNRGISVLQPSVNHSVQDFKVDEQAIRFGFGGIRNMGSYGQFIIEEREQNGQFTSLYNFIERMASNYGINRKRIESLIYSGAFDAFPGSRKEKLDMIDLLSGLASSSKADKANGTTSLLATPLFQPVVTHLFGGKDTKEMEEKVLLEREREYTGFYVSGHPMDEYASVFNNPNVKLVHPIIQTLPSYIEGDEGTELIKNDQRFGDQLVRIAGVVQEIEFRTTRNHQQMANLVIEDHTASIKAIVFPTLFSQYVQALRNGTVLSFLGKVEVSEFGTQFIINGIETMDELMTPDAVSEVTLYLSDNISEARYEYEQVMEVFAERQSLNTVPFTIVMNGRSYKTRGGKPILGNTGLSTIVKLQNLLGRKSVLIDYHQQAA